MMMKVMAGREEGNERQGQCRLSERSVNRRGGGRKERTRTHQAPKLPTPHAPTAQFAAAPTSAHRPDPPPPPMSVPRLAVRLNTNRKDPTLTPATMPNRSE